jgi:hypothetical protein
LQTTREDNALREKIVNLAWAHIAAPDAPEDARRYLARATAAVQSAKNPADFKLALPKSPNASNIAPW